VPLNLVIVSHPGLLLAGTLSSEPRNKPTVPRGTTDWHGVMEHAEAAYIKIGPYWHESREPWN
jgi:hypothetical protein